MSDFIYLCPECGSCFSSENSLQEHDLAVHSSQEHVCFVCHKVLAGLELLERHMTAHRNLLHCCNVCGELCENKADVYVHVTTSHKHAGKMVCDLCSKTFSSNSSLKVHYINAHAAEMPHALEKWELFCNIHSSLNLSGADALKDSFYPSEDCPLHPTDKEFGDKTNSGRKSYAPTSNLLSDYFQNDERKRNCPESTLTELQIFLQEQGDKETWYAKSTDHLSSSIRPNDILELNQPLTENKNHLQKDQSIECRFCDTTFSNMQDYLLAHDGKDPSNVYPHKKQEKPTSQTRLPELFELCKSTVGNTSYVAFKNCVTKQLSGDNAAVIQEDENACAENQNDQLEPDDTLLAEISLSIQSQNKYVTDVDKKDQLEPNDTLLAERSALTSQSQNKNASDENHNFQLEQNGSLLAEMSTLKLKIQNKNAVGENKNDELYPNGTLLAEISALTVQNQNENATAQNDQSEANCVLLEEASGTDNTK